MLCNKYESDSINIYCLYNITMVLYFLLKTVLQMPIYYHFIVFYYFSSSFHELGIYDLPAAIDLVLSITGYNKVDIGGISLGSTVPLITLSERPEYNAKVRTLVLMGPAARTGSSFRNALFYFIRQDVKIILVILSLYRLIFCFHNIAYKI